MWVKLDDGFFDHPKVRRLTHGAIVLYLAGLTYSARLLTDGLIDKVALRLVKATADADAKQVKELVDGRLWDVLLDGGYRVHDWTDYNPPAEEVLAKRRAAQERMKQIRSGVRSSEQNGEQADERDGEQHANEQANVSRGARASRSPYPVPRTSSPVAPGSPPVSPPPGGRDITAPRKRRDRNGRSAGTPPFMAERQAEHEARSLASYLTAEDDESTMGA